MRAVLIGLREDTQSLVQRILTERGHTILAAADVESACRLLGGDTANAIVIESSTSNDLAASCAVLRRSPACRAAIILAIVSGEDEGQVERLLDAGVNDFHVSSLGWRFLQRRLRVVERAAIAAAARVEAEHAWAPFFEMSHDLMSVAGSDGRFKRVNPSFTATLGWTTAELLAKPWLDFVHPADHAMTSAARDRLGDGEAANFANRYQCKDGTFRWLDWRCVPSDDRVLIYASARDITYTMEAQAALLELTESLSTTLSSIGDGVIATDLTGAVIRMNPVAERLTGWKLEEAKGKRNNEIFRVVSRETRATVPDPVERALSAGSVAWLARGTLLLRPDGSELPITDSCAPIQNVDGKVSGAVLVFRDVSGELQAKEAAEKVQRQLIISERMASVGTLAAGVAHEINNPLTYVLTNIELVIEELRALGGGSASGRMRELEEILLEAQQGAERVKKIVRGLKTFSRSGDERRTVIDVRPVLELSINMAFNEIRHRARVVKDFGPVPFVDVDDARLGQVFINLLVNAAQALPEANAEANEIRVVTSTDAAGGAIIEVGDTGRGIPEAILPHIFEPFFTTKPVGVGTGLGLSICNNIVTGMGGELTVESEVGRGTTFRVRLPPSDRPPGAPLAHSPGAATSNTRRGAVLVVDDEPSIGVMLRRVLEAHDVTVTTNARDALALIAAGRQFDVILSDLMMPQKSGMEFYDELSTSSPEHAQRMVFITGGAFTAGATAFLSRVGNERVEKPFDANVVRSLVQRFIKP